MMNTFKQYTLALSIISFSLFISCNSGSSSSSLADTTSASITDTKKQTSVVDTLSNASADTRVNLIKQALTGTLLKNDLPALTDNDRRFIYSTADLNGDGKNEIFVGMRGTYFCGNAGCTVFLLNSEGKKITTFSIVDGPVTVLTEKSKGWNNLIIPSRGVNYLVTFDGKKYPSNPSVQPKFNDSIPANSSTVLAENLKEETF